jgi:toxin HigB-1
LIVGFADQATRDIFDGADTKAARSVARTVWPAARRKLDMLNGARELRDLRLPPGNRLERLKGNMRGFHSIRVNDQHRIIFEFADGNASQVQITDYHR